MNVVTGALATVLASRNRDLVVGLEFYASTYEPHVDRGFEPSDAVARYSTETATLSIYEGGVSNTDVSYERQVLSIGTLNRTIGKQSNTVQVRFSNVSRDFAAFVLGNTIEGMRMVIRLWSRSTNDAWWILFVGRCDRPEGFNREDGSITARQDLGNVESLIPPRIFQKDCPLLFKGEECLGTELLGDKSAAYQAATTCNKTHTQCLSYENEEFFQGIRAAQIPGSFIHKPHHGFLYKLVRYTSPIGYLATNRFGKHSQRIGSSLEDGTPYGQARPVVLGRALMNGLPIQYKDRGAQIDVLMAFCQGPIVDIIDARVLTLNFIGIFEYAEHLGEYGGDGTQTEDARFPLGGFYSRLAYITGYCAGTDIAVEDPAPEINAIIVGVKTAVAYAAQNSGASHHTAGELSTLGYNIATSVWTDNPPDLVRAILLDPALLNLPGNWVDGSATGITSYYCAGVIRDDTNGERLVLPSDQTGKAGTEYFRYYSTGRIGPGSWTTHVDQYPHPNGAWEADYEFYDVDSPPTSFTVKTCHRKRFTFNAGLTEQKKTIDFLFDTLLPSFRGYLTWNTRGQVGVRCERPSDSSLVRGSSVAGATTVQLRDIMPWRVAQNTYPADAGKILIGVGLATSEVRSVTATNYTTASNSITLAASTSGGPTLTPSGATMTGATNTTSPGSGYFTLGGSYPSGATVTATIDGFDCTYTLQDGEDAQGVLGSLAAAINASPDVGPYVEASWDVGTSRVTVTSKMGTLTLSSALAEAHAAGEETIRVMMSFAGKALTYADTTRANILDGSFKFEGSGSETRYNQAKGTFRDAIRDFAESPVVVNDYDDQERVGKVIPYEIDLSGVDNYSQAYRLLAGALAKYGDGCKFFSWKSNGLALQLEEGDVVCASDDSGEFRNVPVRIERVQMVDGLRFHVALRGRIYATSLYDDTAKETDVPLPSGLTNFATYPPDIAFNTTDFPPNGLQQTTATEGITSVRGGALFGASLYPSTAKVRLKRPGESDFTQIATITPDSNLEAIFEFIASVEGDYTVQLEVCGTWGCNPTKPEATITVTFGALGTLLLQTGGIILTQDDNYLAGQ